MSNQRAIKRRISASLNISKITKAMEMVSASKMRKSQDQAVATRPYSQALQISLNRVGNLTNPELHPLLSQHQTGQSVIVLFSTDKGLCGGLNTNLFKALLETYRHLENPQVIAIGKKAVAFCHLYGLNLLAQFTNLPNNLKNSDILALSTLLIDGFSSHEFRQVKLIYMDFINTLSQKVKVIDLLPLKSQTLIENDQSAIKLEYTFEPNPQEILNSLLPFYIENTLYQVLLESRASEHSARMVAMKNASENAQDLVGELRLSFNKSRQAAITSELLDITTASLTV